MIRADIFGSFHWLFLTGPLLAALTAISKVSCVHTHIAQTLSDKESAAAVYLISLKNLSE